MPSFIIESLKTGSIDVRLDIEMLVDITENKANFCLIKYDTIMHYTQLSSTV